MATVQERNKSFRILFCHKDRRFTFTLGRVSRCHAEAHAEKVDELLGTLALPEGVDLVTFMLHKGKPPVPRPDQPAVLAAAPVTLAGLLEKYLQAYGNGAMGANSLNERLKKKYRGKPLSPVTLKTCPAAPLLPALKSLCKRLRPSECVPGCRRVVPLNEPVTVKAGVAVPSLAFPVDCLLHGSRRRGRRRGRRGTGPHDDQRWWSC
jgi:hypothetical protein